MGGSRSHSSAALAVVTKSATVPTAATAVRRSATVSPHSRTSAELCMSRPTARNGLHGLDPFVHEKANAGGVLPKEDLQELSDDTLLHLDCNPRGARLPAAARRRQGRPRRGRRGGEPCRPTACMGAFHSEDRWRTWGARHTEAMADRGNGVYGISSLPNPCHSPFPSSRHRVMPAGDEPPRCPGFTVLVRHVKACAFELSRERPTSFSVARMFLSEVARPRVSNR